MSSFRAQKIAKKKEEILRSAAQVLAEKRVPWHNNGRNSCQAPYDKRIDVLLF